MKAEKLEWFRFLIIIPLILILVITNIYVDPANIYHDESKEIAQAIIQGNAAYSALENGNEREIKHNLIIEMPKQVECIAVGSSVVMCVNKKIVGTDSFYNFGVSSAGLYDILAQFGLMEVYEKEIKRVIFCVDTYFFDEDKYDADGRAEALMPYADYMLDILNERNPEIPTKDSVSELKTKIEQAFSITYFQAARDYIVKNDKFSMKDNRWGIVEEGFDGSKPYFDVDGSWNYSVEYQANDITHVLDVAKDYDIEETFGYNRNISLYSVDIFIKLIEYLMQKGVGIELYLCPLAPALWERIEADTTNYFILDELEVFVREVADTYDLKITGSYNPHNVGISNHDFYDARHVRREVLDVYFDFKE